MRISISCLGAFMVIVLFSLVCPIQVSTGENTVRNMYMEYRMDQFILHAENVALGRILDLFRQELSVEIYGLEHRSKEEITFGSNGGPIELELKRLLRQLGENNYVFEFVDGELQQVLLFPEGNSGSSLFKPIRDKEMVRGRFGNVVKVQSVTADSQVEALGIEAGDLIIWYDGEIVTGCLELLAAAKKRTPSDEVEMVVVKDQFPIRFLLKGGDLGIGMKTVIVTQEDLDSYLEISARQR